MSKKLCTFFRVILVLLAYRGDSFSQPETVQDILEDGVERWYRVRHDDRKPAFFEETERAFNVKIIAEDYGRLPFEKSIAFLVGVSKYKI